MPVDTRSLKTFTRHSGLDTAQLNYNHNTCIIDRRNTRHVQECAENGTLAHWHTGTLAHWHTLEQHSKRTL